MAFGALVAVAPDVVEVAAVPVVEVSVVPATAGSCEDVEVR